MWNTNLERQAQPLKSKGDTMWLYVGPKWLQCGSTLQLADPITDTDVHIQVSTTYLQGLQVPAV